MQKWRRYAKHYQGLHSRVAVAVMLALGKAAAAAFFALTLGKLISGTLNPGKGSLIDQSALLAIFLAVLAQASPSAFVITS